MKRDGGSTREVKIASSSAEPSDEAYFCANCRSRDGRASVGLECDNAGHGTSGRARRHNRLSLDAGLVPEERPAVEDFLSEPYGDRAATWEVAESGKIGKPRTGAFPLP
jgi:hypothetical protein